jgi:hypothetical protein
VGLVEVVADGFAEQVHDGSSFVNGLDVKLVAQGTRHPAG